MTDNVYDRPAVAHTDLQRFSLANGRSTQPREPYFRTISDPPRKWIVGRDMSTRYPDIVQTAGVLGGKPRLAGRRIAVQQIAVYHYQMNMTAERIAQDLQLDVIEVLAALRYYADHRAEIDATLQSEARFAEEMQQQHMSPLQIKLRAMREQQ